MTESRLIQAIRAAERRKRAVLVMAEDDEGLSFISTQDQSRAVLSGFDFDYDELRAIAEQAGHLFGTAALGIPLIATHEAAWTEGFLVGLLFSNLPPASEVGDTEVTDPDGLDDEFH